MTKVLAIVFGEEYGFSQGYKLWLFKSNEYSWSIDVKNQCVTITGSKDMFVIPFRRILCIVQTEVIDDATDKEVKDKITEIIEEHEDTKEAGKEYYVPKDFTNEQLRDGIIETARKVKEKVAGF